MYRQLGLDEVGSVGHDLLQALVAHRALPLRHQMQHVLALRRQALLRRCYESVFARKIKGCTSSLHVSQTSVTCSCEKTGRPVTGSLILKSLV